MGLRVNGVREVRKMLEELRSRTVTVKPFLDAEATRLKALIQTSWSSRRGPDGVPWPPYKDERRTGGRLRGAARIKATARRLSLKATFIARFQYFGTEFLPARNPLPFLPAENLAGVLHADDDWLSAHGDRYKAYVLGETTAEGT